MENLAYKHLTISDINRERLIIQIIKCLQRNLSQMLGCRGKEAPSKMANHA